jgi:hypothetical protein
MAGCHPPPRVFTFRNISKRVTSTDSEIPTGDTPKERGNPYMPFLMVQGQHGIQPIGAMDVPDTAIPDSESPVPAIENDTDVASPQNAVIDAYNIVQPDSPAHECSDYLQRLMDSFGADPSSPPTPVTAPSPGSTPQAAVTMSGTPRATSRAGSAATPVKHVDTKSDAAVAPLTDADAAAIRNYEKFVGRAVTIDEVASTEGGIAEYACD